MILKTVVCIYTYMTDNGFPKKTFKQTQLGWWLAKGYSADEAASKLKERQALGGAAKLRKSRQQLNEFFTHNPTIGNWTVVSGVIDGSRRGLRNSIQVQCSCGTTQIVGANQLRAGKTKSCLRCSRFGVGQNAGQDNHRWSGYKELTGSKFQAIRNGANTRGIEFDLTIEYLYDLYQQQGSCCVLSGVPLSWQVASLDRIDSSRGYIVGNVQWVHSTVNYMKHTMTDTELIVWCSLIHRHNKEGL